MEQKHKYKHHSTHIIKHANKQTTHIRKANSIS